MTDAEFSDRSIYRQRVAASGLVAFSVGIGESDLHVSAERDLSEPAREALAGVRKEIEGYIAAHPEFRDALDPRQR